MIKRPSVDSTLFHIEIFLNKLKKYLFESRDRNAQLPSVMANSCANVVHGFSKNSF